MRMHGKGGIFAWASAPGTNDLLHRRGMEFTCNRMDANVGARVSLGCTGIPRGVHCQEVDSFEVPGGGALQQVPLNI